MAESPEITKPVGGAVFILGWAIGITLWAVAHLAPDATTGGFVVDIGILFACIAMAAPFVANQKSLMNVVYLAFVGLLLVAIGHYGDASVLVYLVRLLAPLLAIMAPVYKLLSFRIFA